MLETSLFYKLYFQKNNLHFKNFIMLTNSLVCILYFLEYIFMKQLPTKNQMLKKIQEGGFASLKDWSKFDLKRTKRLMTRDQIKSNNMAASEDE